MRRASLVTQRGSVNHTAGHRDSGEIRRYDAAKDFTAPYNNIRRNACV